MVKWRKSKTSNAGQDNTDKKNSTEKSKHEPHWKTKVNWCGTELYAVPASLLLLLLQFWWQVSSKKFYGASELHRILGWSQVLRKGNQFLLHWCYSCYNSDDKSQARNFMEQANSTESLGDLMCSGRVFSSCCTCSARRVTLITNSVNQSRIGLSWWRP